MERWTHAVVKLRWPILAAWLAVLLAGGLASTRLSSLQSNVFTVPGSDSERVRSILERRYGDRSDGSFTVVFRVRGSSADPALRARLQAAVDRAARILPTGRPTPLVPAGGDVLYADIASTLTLAEAKRYADDVYAAVGQPPRTTAYVTGPASIQHDLDPIFSGDLQRGEAIALPIALAVLVAVLGLSYAVTIPFLFAGFTIFGTLGLVWIAAHFITTPTYVTNLVFLIGLGIAIDYSLLVVYRFREELAGGRTKEEALLRTMQTAGRAVVFSGATVAIGLALLLFMPMPFMRAMGVGGFLIPLVSIAAALTAQPALLSLYGRRGTARAPVAGWARSLGVPLPRLPGALESERSFWARLSVAIMRRPLAFVAVAGALMLAAASPVFALELTPGSVEGIPRHPQSVQGFDLLRETIGPGAISPTQVLVDAGREGAVLAPRTQAAIASLVRKLEADPEVAAVYYARGGRFVEPGRRYALILVAGRHEYGDQPAQAFVRRLRDDLLPSVRWPSGVKALAGGGPAQGVDFLDETYSAFPWLVLAVLGLTYLLLLRAFRSLFLPLKAVLLNLLSVAAAYGLLVTVFKWGVGNDVLGLYRFDQVEGWIPVFLFAMLFGLSMDYEVFLVSRMREAWDEVGDNGRAVAIGLERTGRIVTAAAVIMVAAFSGFLAGRIVGLQEFGFGLAAAVLFDATVIRAVLVPALMAVMGRYNWWLPERAARLARVKPSPLEPPAFRATGRENVLVAGEATVSRE